MAVFKCKMCGNVIDSDADKTKKSCEKCGALYALVPVNEELKALYEKADDLRRKCEFESAESIYRDIISIDETQADAYWGAVLCKYCVGCVNDRYMFSRVSICRGDSAESIKSDEDFFLALKNGNDEQKSVYKSEVNKIIKTQEVIFDTMSSEEPFDIFISYKETDVKGNITKDSDTAKALYNQFSKDGFKVFYAPVTLNGVNKKGRKYLTSIFASVNSAKVMLVVGSKPEYFTAEWVKSEWSRFLALTKTDSSKIIIPCFSDMTEGDLPEALEQFQAQNITKTTGIFNVVNTVIEYLRPQKSSSPDPAANIKILGFMALEDEQWNEAKDFFERALVEYNPKDAECYLGKLMIDLKVRKRDDLKNCSLPFDDENLNYKKARRFGKEIKNELDKYNSIIKNRIEEEKNSKIYADAESKLKVAETEAECFVAADIFASIKSYKDSADKIKACEEKANGITYNIALAKLNAAETEDECFVAEIIFAGISYYKDSADKVRECKEKATGITYNTALNKLNAAETENECLDAAKIFEAIKDYKDSERRIKECEEKSRALKEKKYIDTINEFKSAKKEVEYKKAGEQFYSVSGYKDSDILSEKCFSLAEDVKEIKNKSKIVLKTLFPTVSSLKLKKNSEAVDLLIELSGYENLIQYFNEIGTELPVNTISAGAFHTVGLKTDGTVIAVGRNNYGQCDVSEWEDITSVSTGDFHTVGLKSDGTVVAVGSNSDDRCDVSDWNDIIEISVGANHTVGLKSDGTVVAVGSNYNGQCDVSEWKNIIAVSTGDFHTVGLKSDGTVVATNYIGVEDDNYNQCDVSDWKDVIAVSAGYWHTIGLKTDRTVVIVGDIDEDQFNVLDWKDIVAISAGNGYTVGLKSNGTVAAAGTNDYGECNVSDWKDIIAVSAGDYNAIGLKSDGTVVATEFIGDQDYNYGQCDVSNWKDIKTTN